MISPHYYDTSGGLLGLVGRYRFGRAFNFPLLEK